MSLEKYSVEKLIGKGSYGEVFLAKHKKDKRMYVVKKVSLQKASERERKAAEQEAKLLSQLRHPNIVSYRESFQGDQGFLYIVMNYCEGGDLYTKLKAQKATLLEEKQIVEWFVQIAMALQYMHEKHILHRDLKTQNIFLTRSKIIKLGDLGIAKVLENSSDMATTLIGTPYYMSPELFSNKPYNHKSDVWALGCCLYEMCTLRHAFNAKDMSSLVYKILKGKTPPLPKQYSTDLCTIIKTMLDQDPDKRPSVSRLLRHPYIKKQIAAFLEGTKNRQKQRANSAQKKIVEISSNRKESKSNHSISGKSDSGYSEAGLQSIATVSGVDCVIEEVKKPEEKPSVPLNNCQNNKVKHIEKSHSENDVTRVSTESSSSRTPNNMGNRDEIVKKKEREREVIRKQMAQRRKSASEKPVAKDEVGETKVKQVVRNREESNLLVKKPVRQVRSAGSSRTPVTEAKYVISSRPLPKPPIAKPKTPVNEAPLSRSPRARRRYKIGSRSHSLEGKNEDEDDDDEDDDKSTASVDSYKSSQSVSDSSNKLSARERRRLKQQSASVSPLPRPSDSYNTPPLPSPLEIRNRKSQERASKGTPKSHVSVSTSTDSVDGPPRKAKLQIESDSSEEESTGSDLEEVSMDEPVKPRKRQNSEVSSLISALDSTLKLDDRSADRVSPEIEDDDQDTNEVSSRPTGASPSTSGRFRDRLEKLKIECLHGIGEEMLRQACDIINSVSDDEVEDELVKYMGRENFEKYGGSIWQLNFYERFQKS